jgi:hypothetical protein
MFTRQQNGDEINLIQRFYEVQYEPICVYKNE